MKLSIGKLLPFLMLLFVVIGCTRLAYIDEGKREEQDKIIETFNKRFDLHDPLRKAATGRDFDCRFRFRRGLHDNKITLIASHCESTSEFMKEQKLAALLTPENITLFKNAGFEKVVLYDHMENNLIDSKVLQDVK